MMYNSIASIIQDTRRNKVTLVLNPIYYTIDFKLSESDEMCLLLLYTELIKAKIGRTIENEAL